MKTHHILLNLFLIFTLTLGLVSLPLVTAHAQSAELASPDGMLNPDGTLKLDGSFSGSLDLAGYNVQLDPQRGPVFSAENLDTQAVATDEWAALGGGFAAPNRSIRAVLISGTDVFVGGDFTSVGGDTTIQHIAKWNGTTWDGLGPLPIMSGSVYAMAMQGTNLYVGGSFTYVKNNGSALFDAAYIARWDGSAWYALGNNGAGNGSLNNVVTALAVIGTDLYVGGSFTNVNNNGTTLYAADYIAKWNGSAWSALGNNGFADGSLNGAVTALAVNGTNLYVGGSFTNVKNVGSFLNEADYLARWNGSDWFAIGSNGAGNGSLNGPVTALAVSGTNLYVGGSFTDVNHNGSVLNTADYLAKWNGSAWSALGSNGAGNGSLNGAVTALAVSGSNLYVGGSFTDVNNNGSVLNTADYLVQWNGSTWSAVGSNGAGDGSLNAVVYALAINGTNLYTGGAFTRVDNPGGPIGGQFIALWTGSTWTSLASASSSDGAINTYVTALAVMGTDVYAGGWFTSVVNGDSRLASAAYIARWDGSKWLALGSNGAGGGALNDQVYALAVSGTDLYVGGYFTDVNNNGTVLPNADRIAKWDTLTNTWSALGENGSGGGSLNSSVYSLAVKGSTLYVGGCFENITQNNITLGNADYIAKWDTITGSWSALGSNGAGNGSLNECVYALALSGSDLYAGGGFDNVNNNGTLLQAADYVARWNGSAWSSLGENAAINNTVSALAVIGSDLYVGGSFTDANDISEADYIAKWDGSNWSALGSNGAGDGAISSYVLALAVSGSSLYVGGSSFTVNNHGIPLDAANSIARWNGSNWSALGSGGAVGGPLNDSVYALAVGGTTLYTGGGFHNVNNHGAVLQEADYIAAYGLPIFADVPVDYWSRSFIERLYNAGVTGGCGTQPLVYCPNAPVTRAQMAVFLLVAEHGSGYVPPAASGLFNDVPVENSYARWIEQLAAEGITGGCGNNNYCPNAPVSRAQMAVFLLIAQHGSGYTPPAASGIFNDVPASDAFAPWIERLATEGITGGCGGGNYCPNTSVNRGQMAVFLVTVFNLP